MAIQKELEFSPLNIALNLYRLRIQREMTHESIAELLGVSVRTIYFWEEGTKCPSLNSLVALSRVLMTSVDSILRTP